MTTLLGLTAADPAALLAARAAQLARPLDEESDQGTLDLLVVTVGSQRAGISLADVREVRSAGRVAQVPGRNGAIAGVVAGHGDALAVASLGGLLGLRMTEPAAEQWVVVLEDTEAPVGLLVDSVLDAVRVARSELSAPSDAGGLVSGLLPDGTHVLDAGVLLRDPRLTLSPTDLTEELLWHDA